MSQARGIRHWPNAVWSQVREPGQPQKGSSTTGWPDVQSQLPPPQLPGCHMTDSLPDTAATQQQSARHGMRRGFVEVAAAAAVTLVHYSCEACCSSTAAKNRNNRHRGSCARAAMGNTSCCDQPSQTCHHSPVKLTPHIAQQSRRCHAADNV